MSALRSSSTMINKRALTQAAMLESLKARSSAGLDFINPICVFDLAERLGVTVRFTDIDMEGMYDKVPKPRIYVSSLRPLPRRNFTCGHELGHHQFGHGSTIDEMQEEAQALKDNDPDEFLVNSFAAFTLMPTVGLRGAFARRGCTIETADEVQIFSITCNFGVGYATIISHLTYGIGEMAPARARQLLKASPKSIRNKVLGDFSPEPLILVDRHWLARPIDCEVESAILLPSDTHVDAPILRHVRDDTAGRLFVAAKPGIGRVSWGGADGTHFVRVARKNYAGLARYRHLEDDDV